MWRLPAIAFLLLCAFGAAQAETVHFAPVAVGNVPAGPQITGWLLKPSGSGPFPAVVLAHSCAGMNRHTDAWGARLVKWGYIVLAPDSFNPRGTNAVCTTPGVVTPNMRVPDIAGALDFLSAYPGVIRDRIGLIGHSHGGATVLRAVQKTFDLKARGLRAAVAYYPGCAPSFNAGIDVPVLILIGDRDDWTSAGACRRLRPDRPELVDIVYYPQAYHSFDARARDRTVPGAAGKMHHLAYDPVAAPDAEARTQAFFDRLLKR
jgi:dienelactone hydrolase